MTRKYYQTFHCQWCNRESTAETAFSRWTRNNQRLASSNGYCIVDNDYFIHQFKRHRKREFQLCMKVEMKSHGSVLTDAQRDSLHIVNQFFRNRSETPTKKKVYQPGNELRVHSIINNRKVIVRAFGVHVLRFSGAGPLDSEWIEWDKRVIDLQTLEDIIAFDRDPDTLRPMELRSHHIDPHKSQLNLF